jgi:hypothetical protein
MIVLEVLLGVILLGFTVATVVMAIVAGLCLLGLLRFVRCPSCDRLSLVPPGSSERSCAHCRHPDLYHPLHSLHGHLLHKG